MIELFEYGYLGLLVSSFLAATVIPFSSEALLSFLVYNDFNIYYCVIIATLGNTIGGMTSYYLGYLGKWDWLEKYFRIKKAKIEKLHNKLKYKGSIIAFFSWLPIIGDLLAVWLGLMRINSKFVLIYMFIGKMSRYIVWIYLTELLII